MIACLVSCYSKFFVIILVLHTHVFKTNNAVEIDQGGFLDFISKSVFGNIIDNKEDDMEDLIASRRLLPQHLVDFDISKNKLKFGVLNHTLEVVFGRNEDVITTEKTISNPGLETKTARQSTNASIDLQITLFQKYQTWKLPDDFERAGFIYGFPTKIIIHKSAGVTPDLTIIKNAYLEKGHNNVIGVAWSNNSSGVEFQDAKLAGLALGNFLNWIIEKGVIGHDIHLIGSGLNAYVAAIAAKKVIGNGDKIGRITGLDPYSDDNTPIFSISAARLVDIIHTSEHSNAGKTPEGHLDFYPNGGRVQPGCVDGLECSHARASLLFAESIRNPISFRAYGCDKVEKALEKRCVLITDVYMGTDDSYVPGIYYVKTRERSPYGMIF